jgi:hypothetical protein
MSHGYGSDEDYIDEYIEGHKLPLNWNSIAKALIEKYPL